jgi:tRNA1(Val) A37 N6-methylase TrmN6
MTRLANIEKADYFPLPPLVTDQIAGHISAPQGGRILDPCAGEGTALLSLAQQLNLDPFGIELHEGRAQAARAATGRFLAGQEDPILPHGRILHDSYLNLVPPTHSFNLLYLNPPYDHDETACPEQV